MRGLIAFVLALIGFFPVSAQVVGEETRMCGGYGTPHSDMPEAFSQFAFIIGDFDVGLRDWDSRAQDWAEPQLHARWNGRYGLGGRAIIDEWFDPGYGYRPQSGAGINIRLWDEQAGIWKAAWHYTTNNEVRELHQELREDGRLWLWQVYPEAAERRVYFEVYNADHWARIEEVYDAESGEWVNSRMLDARRADCEM